MMVNSSNNLRLTAERLVRGLYGRNASIGSLIEPLTDSSSGAPPAIFRKKYGFICPTMDLDALRLRQELIEAISSDKRVLGYFQRFCFSLRLSHYENPRASGIHGWVPYERGDDLTGNPPPDPLETFIFPKPRKYEGKNEIVGALMHVLLEIHPLLRHIAEAEKADSPGKIDYAAQNDLNRLVQLIFGEIFPFIELVDYLKRVVDCLGLPVKKAAFVDDGRITLQQVFPVYLRETGIPMDISLDTRNYAGAILMGPNGSGKSTFLNILNEAVYHLALCGHCFAGGNVEIGWLPTSLARIKLEPKPNIGIGGNNEYRTSRFRKLVQDIYNQLAFNKAEVDGNILMIIDDIFESTTDTTTVRHLYSRLAELHRKEGLYVLSTMRNAELAEQICVAGPFQKIGITKKHTTTPGRFVEDSTGIVIVDALHDEYLAHVARVDK